MKADGKQSKGLFSNWLTPVNTPKLCRDGDKRSKAKPAMRRSKSFNYVYYLIILNW